MRLATSAILREIESGSLVFQPEVEQDRIGPSSVDLTMSDTFYVLEPAFEEQRRAGVTSAINLIGYDWFRFLDTFAEEQVVASGGFLEIPVRQLVIGRTHETVSLPQHLGGRVEGKSSIARIGLFVHISAPTIHPGFDNRIALEFYNVGPLPIRVRPGDSICQLILERVEGEGLYQGQFQS